MTFSQLVCPYFQWTAHPQLECDLLIFVLSKCTKQKCQKQEYFIIKRLTTENFVQCPPGVKLINVLFAGVKLLRTGYQNRVQTSGPGAARTSPDPGTTSSPAARLSSRAKCEGKHLNISVISSLTLTSSGNPVSSIPQIETYTITSPCPSLVPDVNITLVYLDCLAKFKFSYLLCTFTLSHTNKFSMILTPCLTSQGK